MTMLHRLLPAALLGAVCAPVSAQAQSLRAPLQAWLAQQNSASQYEDWFVPFRKALLLAKSTKSTLVPNGGTDAVLYDLLPAIEPLDDGMEAFAAEPAGAVPKDGAAKLLNLAAAFRANGDSLEPLLPWLLLLHKRGTPDACVELCLFEAWGTDALDCSASKAAAERLQSLDEAPLLAFLFEAKAFPAKKPGTAQRLVNQLCADRIDKGAPLGVMALSRALVAEIEKDYEVAMQLGDFPRVASCLEAMLVANPMDWSPQLMLEASGGRSKGPGFADRYGAASPDERTAIDARLQHLGLGIVAPGMSVAAVARAALDGPLDFFRNDLADRSKPLDAAIKQREQSRAKTLDKVKDLRDDIAELERKVKKYSRTVGERSMARDFQLKADKKKVEADKLDAEATKDLEVMTRLEAEKKDLLGQSDAVKKRRGEFRLQPSPESLRVPTADNPPPTDPVQPPAPPDHQPAPMAPPPADFDVALPQAKELREATADLDLERFLQARTALKAVRVALARLPDDVTTQRMIAVTSYRLGESMQKLAMQKARGTGIDAEAQLLLLDADRELARLAGGDVATAREGSSLHAAALRCRILIHGTLHAGYRDLATAKPNVQTYRTKSNEHGRTAKRLFDELNSSFAAATLPDGRRIVEVAREEAAALAR